MKLTNNPLAVRLICLENSY